ncbi:hypothetical protein ABE288_08890 [Bacillus salipaludis]
MLRFPRACRGASYYLIIDQLTLSWGFLTTAICLVIYLIYTAVIDCSKYE